MLKDAIGFIEGLGEQKIILAETEDQQELIVGRFDIQKQEASYPFDGKENYTQHFKVVDGFVLPKGEKADEIDAVGF